MNDPKMWRGYAPALASILMLSACGGSEPTATDSPQSESPANQGPGSSMINSFDFVSAGAVAAADAPDASQLALTGGCPSQSPLSIGFTHGTPDQAGYFGFSFETAKPVSSGTTGVIPLARITWDNGVETPPNLPANSPIRVPVRFDGEGDLTLQSHAGVGAGGRMAGVVSGVVANATSQQSATVTVGFDIKLACGR